MAFTGITPSQNSGFIPEIFLATALGRLRNYLTLAKTVTMDTDLNGGAFTVGQTLELPKRGVLTVNDRSANGQYTTQAPQSSTVSLSLDNWKEVTFAIDSQAIAFQNQDTQSGYIEDSIIALAEQIDTDIAATISAQSGLLPAGNRISSAAYITEQNVISARSALVTNKVPFNQKKFAVVSTDNVASLLYIDRFTRFDALGVSNNIPDATVGNGIRDVSRLDGAFGRLHGFEFAESQLLNAEGSPGTVQNYFYAQTGLLMATRALPIPEAGTGALGTVMTDPDSGITLRLVKSWNSQYGAEQITLDVLYGITLMRPEHVVIVTTPA